jgi:TPR repeat protein
MSFLGVVHEAQKDDENAYAWYRKAAEAGHAGAMTSLGNFCEKGRGTARDELAAAIWYWKGVDGGNAVAGMHLRLLSRFPDLRHEGFA